MVDNFLLEMILYKISIWPTKSIFGRLLELSGSKINSKDKIIHININAKPIIYRNIFLTKLSFKIHV